MNEQGAHLTQDGKNGDKLKAAVAEYQHKNHLKETGYVNDSTFAQMQKDGFDVDKAFQKEHDYLTDAGKPYAAANTEAIYAHEVAYATGSSKSDAAIGLENPPRQGFAVAAIQNQMNADYERVYGDKMPDGYKPIPVTGVFDKETEARVKEWQADKTLHNHDTGTFVETAVNGKFDRAMYDAFHWSAGDDGVRKGDDYAKNGLDIVRFKKDALDPSSELAQNLETKYGKGTVDKIIGLEAMEQGRRSELEIGGAKLNMSQADSVGFQTLNVAAVRETGRSGLA